MFLKLASNERKRQIHCIQRVVQLGIVNFIHKQYLPGNS